MLLGDGQAVLNVMMTSHTHRTCSSDLGLVLLGDGQTVLAQHLVVRLAAEVLLRLLLAVQRDLARVTRHWLLLKHLARVATLLELKQGKNETRQSTSNEMY